MANKCGCGKRISRGATHCGKCARSGGGYQSNMAAQLAEVARQKRVADMAKAAAEAKASKDRAAAQKKIADRAKKMRSGSGQPTRDQTKASRTISNVRGKGEQPKKNGWW
jgi:hypothetical protein